MKNIARITLLILWLFALSAPSVITIFNINDTIVLTNLNEEEQQESVKKSIGEEKFVKENYLNFSLIASYKNLIQSSFQVVDNSILSLDVVSPPPKYIS
ncbi:hypothetical protein [Maribacter hydrothermalis]|uniref:Uncharacterized protein n=1 Tax=Maribacter hydrothermalis TaxID=1836467 RepID=A0A1B7Z403_9FLAO|nr:hypothetical protein [Maribacter hydrothermalis]APQ17179.1 hypothetical protein BTR34_07490 [Maribacter hydrothermalis]OBR37439.1 hypothetical protein A9200_07240 [Maribacter hydrothermalis]